MPLPTAGAIHDSAARALSRLYGRPVASGKFSYAAADAHTDGLKTGFYVLYAVGGDVCFSDTGAAVIDGTCPIIPGGQTAGVWLGTGADFNLHAIRVSADGVLWWSRMDDPPLF